MRSITGPVSIRLSWHRRGRGRVPADRRQPAQALYIDRYLCYTLASLPHLVAAVAARAGSVAPLELACARAGGAGNWLKGGTAARAKRHTRAPECCALRAERCPLHAPQVRRAAPSQQVQSQVALSTGKPSPASKLPTQMPATAMSAGAAAVAAAAAPPRSAPVSTPASVPGATSGRVCSGFMPAACRGRGRPPWRWQRG